MRPTPHVSRRQATAAIITGAAGLALGGCAPTARTPASREPLRAPPLPREFRAAWVATVDNIDWPTRPALSPAAQRAEIEAIVDEAARLHLNALLVQVRPTSDALYRSDAAPWSAFLTGQQGLAPSPEYDPLETWIDTAHARGIDVHAWINPFRARHPVSIGADAPNHIVNRAPHLVRKHGPYLWLDPGEPEARAVALDAAEDLLERYPIAGIHLDDYFYPYPRDDEPFDDAASFGAYRRAGGRLDRAAWRRSNIDELIGALRLLVRSSRPGSLLTISPFGIWRPDHPAGVRGFDAFAGLHADSRRWIRDGMCDAIMPQLYWPIASEGQPFEPLLDWWIQQNLAKRHVWPGLYLTRIKPAGSDEKSWEPDEIDAQIRRLRTRHGAGGFALFSMVGLMENRRGVADRLGNDVLRRPALVPESPWAGGARLDAPDVAVEPVSDGVRIDARWRDTTLAVRRVAFRVRQPDGWRTAIVNATPGSASTSLTLRGTPGRPDAAIVDLVGPNGRSSDTTVLTERDLARAIG